MKKTILLSATCILALALACKKQDKNLAEQPTECQECKVEQYRSLSGDHGIADKGVFNGYNVSFTKIDGHNVFEGDMLLTDEQIGKSSGTEGTILNGIRYWSGRRIYYAFEAGLPQATKNKFLAAAAHWRSQLGFVFTVRTNQANYILVRNGGGCSSYVGMIGGGQALTLASGCSTGNAIHEIGHAVGLMHEQTRADRDNYITVRTQNITPGYEGNFTRCTTCSSNGTLDFGSIMLYDSYAFSKNGQPTIVKKNGSTYTTQRNGLSANDKAIVLTKY